MLALAYHLSACLLTFHCGSLPRARVCNLSTLVQDYECIVSGTMPITVPVPITVFGGTNDGLRY